MKIAPHIHICLPVLNEYKNLQKFIIQFEKQSFILFSLYVCVNQAEEWWEQEDKLPICEDNAKSISYLSSPHDFPIHIIDRSSRGNGWVGKKNGVGWARKLTMDKAVAIGHSEDIILSVDADTQYPANYLQSIYDLFVQDAKIIGHSNPYYHPLTGKPAEDSAILRYELYMRSYAINMLHIDNPYAFSAIGSGMACTIAQYKKVGGISPKASGEDFYFIQRLRKTGKLSNYNETKVFPQARFSDRVNFGTGPAMIKGNKGDWSSYPFYSPILFQQIEQSYQSFDDLYLKDIETPMTAFLQKQLKRSDLWGPFRKNYKTKAHFIRACVDLVDGLRILQFLKEAQKEIPYCEEENFMENLRFFATFDEEFKDYWKEIGYSGNILSFENMKTYRDILTFIEYKYRKQNALLK